MAETPKKNEAWWDRMLRLSLLPVVGYLAWAGYMPIWLAVVLAVPALMFARTATTGVCPIYQKAGISTLRK